MEAVYESDVEEVAIGWLREMGWNTAFGSDIAPESSQSERVSFEDVDLKSRLINAVSRINPDIPESALEDAIRKTLMLHGTTLESKNRSFHQMLVNGLSVEYQDISGQMRGANVNLINFNNPSDNDFLAVNQFTVLNASKNLV